MPKNANCLNLVVIDIVTGNRVQEVNIMRYKLETEAVLAGIWKGLCNVYSTKMSIPVSVVGTRVGRESVESSQKYGAQYGTMSKIAICRGQYQVLNGKANLTWKCQPAIQ